MPLIFSVQASVLRTSQSCTPVGPPRNPGICQGKQTWAIEDSGSFVAYTHQDPCKVCSWVGRKEDFWQELQDRLESQRSWPLASEAEMILWFLIPAKKETLGNRVGFFNLRTIDIFEGVILFCCKGLGTALCIVGYSTTSLASIPKKPVVTLPQGDNRQRLQYCQMSPEQNRVWLRATGVEMDDIL